jgi:hypothetical protein
MKIDHKTGFFIIKKTMQDKNFTTLIVSGFVLLNIFKSRGFLLTFALSLILIVLDIGLIFKPALVGSHLPSYLIIFNLSLICLSFFQWTLNPMESLKPAIWDLLKKAKASLKEIRDNLPQESSEQKKLSNHKALFYLVTGSALQEILANYASLILVKLFLLNLSLIFILVNFTYATIYYRTAHILPGSFSNLKTLLDALYFSLTTMVTIGYGDVCPVSAWAKIVVITQVIISLLLLTFTIISFSTIFLPRMESSLKRIKEELNSSLKELRDDKELLPDEVIEEFSTKLKPFLIDELLVINSRLSGK